MPARRGNGEWDWHAFRTELELSPERIAIGQEVISRLQAAIDQLGRDWEPYPGKGFVNFKRAHRYTTVGVDLYWVKPPRLIATIPAPPRELNLSNPFLGLDTWWTQSEWQWGWTVPSLNDVPDVERLVALIQQILPYHPDRGPIMRLDGEVVERRGPTVPA